MSTVRGELKLLQNQAASLKELLENNKASFPGGALLPLLDVEDIEDLEGGVCSNSSLTSEVAPASEDLNVTVNLTYIVSRPLHGKHGNSVGKFTQSTHCGQPKRCAVGGMQNTLTTKGTSFGPPLSRQKTS